MSNLVIKCTDINKIYQDGKNKTQVLKGVNLELEQGELLAIVGSSGSGKSTLLHILGTLDVATDGTSQILDQDVAKLSRKQQAEFRNKNLGFIYQFHHLLMEFNALENVAMPLLIAGMKPNPGFTTVDNVRYKCDRTSLQLTAGLERKSGDTRTASSSSLKDSAVCVHATFFNHDSSAQEWEVAAQNQKHVQEAKRRGS